MRVKVSFLFFLMHMCYIYYIKAMDECILLEYHLELCKEIVKLFI